MKKTIRNNMLMSYMILIWLTACIMSGLYIYKNYCYAREQSIGEIEKESKQVLKELENLFEQIEIIQYQAVDIVTKEKNQRYKNENLGKRKLEAHKNMEEELMSLRRSYTYIQDIFWIPEDSWLCSTQGDVDKDKLLSGTGVSKLHLDQGPYVEVHRQDCLLGEEPGSYVFSYVKNIYSIYDIHTIRGILQIDFKYEELKRRMDVINSNMDSLAYISDEENRLVFFPDPEEIGNPASAASRVMKEKNIDQDSYSRVYTLPNGWNLEIYMSYDAAEAYFGSNMKTSVILIILFTVAASCYAYRASQSITSPLHALTRNLTEMEHSGQLKRLQASSELEELQILERRFNHMAEQLDSMIEATVKARSETLKARFAALQLQINPHFLSNCFEMIRSQAVQSQNYEIEKITEALAMMYRYIMNDITTEVYLKEEVQYVKNYVQIQEFRFGEKIQVFYRVDERAWKQRIPCLVIQPLVENVFKHGFPRKGKNQMIIIQCVIQGGRMCISVEDNGVGIPSEKLEQIRNMLEEDQGEESDTRNGIGLKNVNYRLKIRYGQKAGLSIESTPERGTKISFEMEARENHEDIDS